MQKVVVDTKEFGFLVMAAYESRTATRPQVLSWQHHLQKLLHGHRHLGDKVESPFEGGHKEFVFSETAAFESPERFHDRSRLGSVTFRSTSMDTGTFHFFFMWCLRRTDVNGNVTLPALIVYVRADRRGAHGFFWVMSMGGMDFIENLATLILKFASALGFHRGAEGDGDGCASSLLLFSCKYIRHGPLFPVQ